MSRANDSVAVNQVGEPDAGNPHVRFDERRLETGPRLPRQSSTLLIPGGVVEWDVAGREVGSAIESVAA